MHKPEVDRRIAAVARDQHGLLTRRQARALGASHGMLHTRLAAGSLDPIGKQVLRVAGVPVTPQQLLLAAVLDAGAVAAATLEAAAWLWGLPGFQAGAPSVVVPVGTNHRPAIGTVTETRSLPGHHVTVVDRIPVLTPARLIVELAGRAHPRRVERAAENAIAAGTMSPDALVAVVAEMAVRGRRGSTFLRGLADALAPGVVPPASELEARFRDLLRQAGLPEPVRQLDVGGDEWIGRVDVAYPDASLVIELDSRRWHDSRTAMESDRQRDNHLVAAGWRVVRITWRQIIDDPVAVVALVRRLLAQRTAA